MTFCASYTPSNTRDARLKVHIIKILGFLSLSVWLLSHSFVTVYQKRSKEIHKKIKCIGTKKQTNKNKLCRYPLPNFNAFFSYLVHLLCEGVTVA